MQDSKRIAIKGPAISLDGNDIDTDRIIPARFLRCVTFDGLGEHAFEDDRAQLTAAGKRHAFDDPTRQHARVLLVDRNFGCGSSREHAPQALMRWKDGIAIVVGESFAEIFFGNCIALGIPCLTASTSDIQTLKRAVESDPKTEVTVDLETMRASAGSVSIKIGMPDGARKQLMSGRWDSSAELLDGKAEVAKAASQLPYFNHWKTA
ncbi:MAG TPA: 3-isopropylmalate dehydratase small subunit [Polyangiales bacterium]|nr:3-isopropylmalate dehydratase small subunit [Polyangiales bacterium]